MLFSTLRVLLQHGRQQTIKDLGAVNLAPPFRGVPRLCGVPKVSDFLRAKEACPTGALTMAPFTLDMGRCLFCGACARLLPDNISFSQDVRMACSLRSALVVRSDEPWRQVIEPRAELSIFRRALKLRSVVAGGDGANEMELDAAGNVNFDMRAYGIEFVASPRHADGVVLTGPITTKMAAPLEETFEAMAQPRVLITVGLDAISGGMFIDSPAIDRSFLDRHVPDLYVPGHPSHPLTFIDGVRKLMAGGENRA
ncbi:MAG: NADH:ubiquinone oxidoreductase [Mucinivorans sp.]